ncbi:glycosyltransferase family 4 protein [Thermogladius sp. 4427co]|uniref:glycosyltransferase family 4 protein n=1 Tax=Thermogladius sp. 4427co TaxID=3450718 RepID=UPI003F7AD9A8
MKVRFVSWNTGLAGGNRAVFEVANRLYERGYKVDIVALGGDHSWFNVKVPINYIEGFEIAKKNKLISTSTSVLTTLYSVLKHGVKKRYKLLDLGSFIANKYGVYLDLIRYLAENISGADVYIATWYPTALSIWLGTRGDSKKLFFMQDFPELVEYADGDYGLRLFKLTLMLPFIFIANSSYTRDLILEVNPTAKIYVSGVGVDTEIFYPRKKRIIDAGNKYIIMIILRGAWFKGDDIAIKVVNGLNKRIPVMGLLVGHRNIVDKVFRRVRPEFPYIIFSGVNDDELAKLYSNSDLFLFTSYAEGFGLPPLEAMACGTPVVMTDAKGNRDYAINGFNSIIVEPGNIEALTDAAYQVLTDQSLRERLIQGGLETARKWSWEKVVDVFEKAIKEV